MQLAHQGKISLEEDSVAINLLSTKCGSFDRRKTSCNITHTINEDGLLEKKDSSNADECMSKITFTDEDLLFGSKPLNHPLFVAELGIPIDKLSNNSFMIQGFNEEGQRAIGIIKKELLRDDMVSTALFHVIDAKNSCSMLLVRT
ncbi:UNVERIFIED_CONTAM: hypothetical protein Sradi_1317300 [Sesamum radiatum]|uniref:Uncharacterized protein n=1 Tax=Sesamum radiatum TaxID=300843 RepID=A0AAW2UQC8_SESRA